MAKKSKPFVISYGDEDHYLDLDIERARNWAGREVMAVDGDGVTDEEIVELCERPTMDTDRVVVVDNAEGVKGHKSLFQYINSKDEADDSVILVVSFRKSKLTTVWERAAKKGREIEHAKLKPWQTDEIDDAILKEADRLKIRIAKDVPDVLRRLVGTDLRDLASELRKLAVLVGEGGAVNRQQVLLVAAPSVPAEPYEVGEAVLEKDLKRAMNLISLLYRYLGDGAGVPISYSLIRQVEKMIVARQMIDRGDATEVIAPRLGMSPKQCEKHFLPRVRKHSLDHLCRQMNQLCKLDAAVKGPARSKRTEVELAVLSLLAA
jgi:DNA polymerase III delta subunit